jgi:hypothetical protein
LETINYGEWKSGPRSSGKLKNTGKRLFLSIFADSIGVVNQKRDSSGLTFSRTAMTRCGLVLGLGGARCVGQLSSELQETIREHPRYFAGEETASESE